MVIQLQLQSSVNENVFPVASEECSAAQSLPHLRAATPSRDPRIRYRCVQPDLNAICRPSANRKNFQQTLPVWNKVEI